MQHTKPASFRRPTKRVASTPAEVARYHHPNCAAPVKSIPVIVWNMSAAGGASQGAKRKNFSSSERDALILYVLSGSKDGVLKRGAYTEAASRYEWHWETIKRIWIDYENQRTAGVENRKLVSGRKGNCGRKGVDITELRTRLRDVPLNQRTTIRRLARALGVPKSTVFKNLKELGRRAHSNATEAVSHS